MNDSAYDRHWARLARLLGPEVALAERAQMTADEKVDRRRKRIAELPELRRRLERAEAEHRHERAAQLTRQIAYRERLAVTVPTPAEAPPTPPITGTAAPAWWVFGNTLYIGHRPGDWIAFPGDVATAQRIGAAHNIGVDALYLQIAQLETTLERTYAALREFHDMILAIKAALDRGDEEIDLDPYLLRVAAILKKEEHP